MLPLVNDEYLKLQPYQPGKPVAETERELGITGAIKLASNENPYGPSPLAVKAIQQALSSLHDYPDGGQYYLKQALAKKHGVEPSMLLLGNGTNEVIDMVVRTFVRPEEHLLYTVPSFVIYKIVAGSNCKQVRDVPATPDFRHDLDALAKAVDGKTKMVFIDNPVNPTGTYVTRTQLEAFFTKIPDDLVVVMDEAYFEFATAADFPDGLDFLGKRHRLIVLRTFSKCYGLAGLRVGYGVAHAELVDFMNRGRQSFNVSNLAQVGAVAALQDHEHLHRTVTLNKSEMDRLVPRLLERGLGVTPSQANFVLVDFHRPAREVYDALLRLGVIIRPLAPYGLTTHARVSIGSAPQNDRLVASLDQVLGRK
jgi:histidinol-phosphate aminotransferase